MREQKPQDAMTVLPARDRVRSLHDLTGRVALITGGASGLGRMMAWALACQGADVAIIDLDGERAAECAQEIVAGSGRRAVGTAADVSSESAVELAIGAVTTALGDVDILVNNAGHNIRKPLVEYGVAEFDSLYEVHVRGTFLFCRRIAPRMQARRRGSIINIASMLALIGARGVAPYAAAKASIMQLSRVLALEMAPYDVRVNSIAPGYIDTPLTRQHAPEVRARISETTPLGRFGEVTELIGPVLFLASDASSFVTGATLVVDGGWTAQ